MKLLRMETTKVEKTIRKKNQLTVIVCPIINDIKFKQVHPFTREKTLKDR